MSERDSDHESVTDRLESLTDRLATLESELRRKDDRIETLESRVADLESRVDDHDDALESHATELETIDDRVTTTTTKTDAALKKADANKNRLRELQARELEKGAHLHTTTVDPAEVDLSSDHLEKITKDDGRTYYRVPDSKDPLDRSTPTLAHGDLLPIQQLARMDEDLRRSTTDALPTRLAAKLWKARTDPTVGDDPWEGGCKNIDEYVSASDLKHWIRRQEQGISETYAKKLVSRTIDAILELSKNRLAVRKRSQRKNGLEYTERRLILPADAEVPGETSGTIPTEPSPNDSEDSNDSEETTSRRPTSSPVDS